MASVYDRTDIYDLFDSPKKDAQTLSHWQAVFDGRPIRSALDVSIGTGSLTLPLGQLGVSLYGSDLSGSMLARCRKKADERGIAIDLRQSDFRDLTSQFDRSFDCVMSTGNSLADVTNTEITGVLEQMDARRLPLLRPSQLGPYRGAEKAFLLLQSRLSAKRRPRKPHAGLGPFIRRLHCLQSCLHL